MKITISTEDEQSSSANKDLEIKKFAKIEWKKWNLEHYGKKDAFMEEEFFFLKAEENGQIVGFIKMSTEGRVAYIDSLIVKSELQGKGYGEDLIKEAEKLAKEKGCHKIQLETGKNWKQRSFYDHMGYKKTNDFPDQYLRHDFVEYTKYL